MKKYTAILLQLFAYSCSVYTFKNQITETTHKKNGDVVVAEHDITLKIYSTRKVDAGKLNLTDKCHLYVSANKLDPDTAKAKTLKNLSEIGAKIVTKLP